MGNQKFIGGWTRGQLRMFIDKVTGNGGGGGSGDITSVVAGTGLSGGATTGAATLNIEAAQAGITSLLAADIKIGEDDQTKIDFEDVNTINFYANNAKEMVLVENSLSPGTSDGTALGTTSSMWSDLFLASAAVVNFNNGDATLTHAAGKLTFGGDGAVEIDFNNHEMTNVDINSGDIGAVTISAGLTWSAAQNLNSQALTNVNFDSGDINAATISGALSWNAAQNFSTGTTTLASVNIDAGTIDNVSIGTSFGLPCTELRVDDVHVNGKVITMTGSTDDTAVFTAGTHGTLDITTTDTAAAAADITLDADGKIVIEAVAGDEVVFNEGGLDVDFRVESDSYDHMLFVNAGSNVVGINTSSPAAYLDIRNTVDDGTTNRTMLRLHNYRDDDADVNDFGPISIDFDIENLGGGTKTGTARIAAVSSPVGTDHSTVLGEKTSALIFSTMNDDTLAEALRINAVGNVGIGVTDPDTALEILSTTTPQLKVSYDAAGYASIAVADASHTTIATAESGNLTLDAAGNLVLDAAGTAELVGTTITLDSGGSVNVESDALNIGNNGDTDIVVTFSANSNDGALTWMEDEDEFRFAEGGVGNSVRGKFLHFTHHAYNRTGAQKFYIPFAGTGEDELISAEWVKMLAPYDGKLLKVIVNGDGVESPSGIPMGSTVVGLHLDENDTAATTVTATIGQSVAGTGISTAFNFTSSNTFSEGQKLSISVDPSAAPLDIQVTCVWEFDQLS